MMNAMCALYLYPLALILSPRRNEPIKPSRTAGT
jgi:hypothetical protein